MARRMLRFPSQGEPQGRDKNTLGPQQEAVSAALRIFREVESRELPTPGLVGKWLRDLAHGDADLLLYALDFMATRGQLNVSLRYCIAVLMNGLKNHEFADERAAQRRPVRAAPVIGQVTPNGKYFWDGSDWDLVEKPRERT